MVRFYVGFFFNLFIFKFNFEVGIERRVDIEEVKEWLRFYDFWRLWESEVEEGIKGKEREMLVCLFFFLFYRYYFKDFLCLV